MVKFRGFISIDVNATPQIIEFENDIRKTGANIKLVNPKNIHITLKFLGDTDEILVNKIEEIINESVIGIKPFDIVLVGTGVFPNEKYIKVIWIGIKQGGKSDSLRGRGP